MTPHAPRSRGFPEFANVTSIRDLDWLCRARVVAMRGRAALAQSGGGAIP